LLTAVAGQRIPRRAWAQVSELSGLLSEAGRVLQTAKRQAELLQRRAYFDGRAAGIAHAQSESIKHVLDAQKQARELVAASELRIVELAVSIVAHIAPRLEQGELIAALAALRGAAGAGGVVGAAGVAPGPGTTAPRLRLLQARLGRTIHLVPLADVLYFEAADKYIKVVTAAREYLIRMPLRRLLQQLDPDEFWQVHRAVVVRADAIATAVRDESGKVELALKGHPAKLVASRLYAHLFRAM